MLDARLAGKSMRAIAIELYGEAWVAGEWSPGGSLQSRVRRRVRIALGLMNGGYRELARGGP